MRNASGAFISLPNSQGALGAGSWVLAIRLQHEWRPSYWREAAFIPVLKITVSDAGEVTYAVVHDVLDK